MAHDPHRHPRMHIEINKERAAGAAGTMDGDLRHTRTGDPVVPRRLKLRGSTGVPKPVVKIG